MPKPRSASASTKDLQTIPRAAYLMDELGTIFSWNEAASDLLQYSKSEIIGAKDTLFKIEELVTESGISLSWLVKKDKSLVLVQETVASCQSGQLPFPTYIKFLKDFTHLFTDLEKAHLWFRRYERSSWGVVMTDPKDGTLLKANPEFCSIVGSDLNEMKGAKLIDLFAPSVRADVRKHAQQSTWKTQYDFSSMLLTKKGKELPVNVMTSVGRGKAGLATVRMTHIRLIGKAWTTSSSSNALN